MTRHGRITVFSRTLVGLLLAFALPTAKAALFSVSPTRVELNAKHHSDILTFTNSGTEQLRMQVRVMHWSMAADGQWQLTPSDDLIVTPELLEIAPGKSVQLRVGSLLDAGTSEASYRLLIDELPNLTDDKSAHAPEIKVLTQVSLPVFIEPAQATRSPALNSATTELGALLIGIGNNGTQRMDPQSIKLTVLDRQGRVLETQDHMANYILPGSQWFLHAKLPAQACEQAASVTVSLPGMANTSITHSITTGAGACEGTNTP